VYVDGILKNSITIPAGNLRTGNGYTHIGRAQVGQTTTLPSYVVKDASFWAKAFSSSEIAELTDSNLTGKEAGLVAFYPFNQSNATGDGNIIINKATKTVLQ
jgi:hypothetical protein